MRHLGIPDAAADLIFGSDWHDTEEMLASSSMVMPDDAQLETDHNIADETAQYIEDQTGNRLIQKALDNLEQARVSLTTVILAEMPSGTKVFWTTHQGAQGTRIATGYVVEHVKGREGELITVRNGKTGRESSISVNRLAPKYSGGKMK